MKQARLVKRAAEVDSLREQEGLPPLVDLNQGELFIMLQQSVMRLQNHLQRRQRAVRDHDAAGVLDASERVLEAIADLDRLGELVDKT